MKTAPNPFSFVNALQFLKARPWPNHLKEVKNILQKVKKISFLFYSYFFVTFEIVPYFVTWKVTSYSNAVTCNTLL